MSGCKNRGLHLKSYQEAVATWFKTHPRTFTLGELITEEEGFLWLRNCSSGSALKVPYRLPEDKRKIQVV